LSEASWLSTFDNHTSSIKWPTLNPTERVNENAKAEAMTTIEFSSKLISLHDKLFYFANTLTQNRDSAKDLIQDTYLKALLNMDKFIEDTNLKAWTFTVMKNIFINNYRHSVKVNTIIDNTTEMFFLNIPRNSEFASPESQIALKDMHSRISVLQADQRIPFEMYTQGYKYKEIAQEMKLSLGTVKSRIFFTRKKLMQSFKDYKC
jgi:RNA polymerase sigma-70 factor (ECF subfamily)